tara:strand:- start:1532 stop:2194 length:663 start_codon:yes stop_codon:yes gene_type:complete
MHEREIVRELRLRLREYFPSLQSYLDQDIITINDWKFYGTIQFNLINCFTMTPEKAIRESKTQLNKISKFYEQESRVRKLALKSNLFIHEHMIERDKLQERYEYYHSHLEYWKKRKQSTEMYFNYEIYMFLYYKWMNNYEFDEENTFKLLLELMEFCNYYAARYFDIERLTSEKSILMNDMKLSSAVLANIDETLGPIDDGKEESSDDFDLIKEAQAHLN